MVKFEKTNAKIIKFFKFLNFFEYYFLLIIVSVWEVSTDSYYLKNRL